MAHFRPAWEHGRYRTPVDADGAGFPDLLLVRRGRLIVAELKSATAPKKLPAAQEHWLQEFRDTVFVEVHVWRPADWDSGAIVEALR